VTFAGLAVKLTGGAAFKLQFSSAGAATVESATFIVIPHGLAVNATHRKCNTPLTARIFAKVNSPQKLSTSEFIVAQWATLFLKWTVSMGGPL